MCVCQESGGRDAARGKREEAPPEESASESSRLVGRRCLGELGVSRLDSTAPIPPIAFFPPQEIFTPSFGPFSGLFLPPYGD